MAGIPVNNNLNALANVVSRAANVSGASYARQDDAAKDSFDMFMNRANSQTDTHAETQTAGAAKGSAGTQSGTQSKKELTTTAKTMSTGVAASDNTAKTTAKSEAADAKQPVENKAESNVENTENAADKDISFDHNGCGTLRTASESADDCIAEPGRTADTAWTF